jgi:hypothetical protein
MEQVIAGKSLEQATMLLLHLRGVHTVGIQIGNGKTTVPGDGRHIAINVYDNA